MKGDQNFEWDIDLNQSRAPGSLLQGGPWGPHPQHCIDQAGDSFPVRAHGNATSLKKGKAAAIYLHALTSFEIRLIYTLCVCKPPAKDGEGFSDGGHLF